MFDGLMDNKEQLALSSFLERAMRRIEDPLDWCTGSFIKAGRRGWRYCALGALQEGHPAPTDLSMLGWKALVDAASSMGYHDPAWVNDTHGHATVMKMYRIAIATAKVQEEKS